MKLKNLLLGALVWAISTLSTTTYAIENLTVAVQGSNAVLSWPASQWYDTFIVRYRPNLNATSSWQTLDNAYPADQNGNPTVFVHSNSVVYLPPGPSGSGGGGPPSPGPGGTNTVTMGNGAPSFYQVVKVGVHLYGITNGMVLSGAVPLPIEFGNNDTNQVLSAVYLQDQDESALPGAFFGWTIDDAATNRITGLWDTTSVTNGTYTIAVGATLSGSQVVDDSVTVTVSNLVWFPDPWTVAGTAIYMGAQSVFTNGIWHMDFFDDQHRYLGYLDGPVDGDGWCNVAGDPGPGFSVGITDTNGVQLPSTNYTVEVTVKASSAVNAAQTKVVKQHVVEPSWNDLNTQSVTAYKQLNDNDESLTYLAVKGMADLVWSIQTGLHPDAFYGSSEAYRLWGPPEWLQMLIHLGASDYFLTRDFFYFGHGGPDVLGLHSSVGEGCTRSFVQQYLNNNQYQGKDVWTQFHPYRFVFLCGCSTAKGNWPQAFGIPKVEGLVNNDFFKRGLRPRAFMGWKHVKWVTAFATGEGSAAYFNDDLAYWVTTFYQAWYHVSSSTGQFDTNLAAAIAAAAIRPPGVPGAGTSNPAQNGIVLYGSKNMMPYNW